MDMGQSTLFNELTQGKRLAEQLRDRLSSSSHQTRQLLIDQILSSYEKALSSLKWVPVESPMNEVSDRQLVFKKRKASKKCDDQLKVCSGSSDGPLNDGFSWRKYGQKDILGSNYPRAYYRCTHRLTQGCLATKQIQRSDDDPTVFGVTYRGRHTCKQTSEPTVPPETMAAESSMEDNKNLVQRYEQKQKQPEEVLLSFGADSNVKNGELASWEDILSLFTFPSSKTEQEEMRSDNIFKDSTVENQKAMRGSFNSSFMSAENSECNYLSVSPSHGGGLNGHSPESDLTETISPPASVTCCLDFHLDEGGLDQSFSLDDPEIFC